MGQVKRLYIYISLAALIFCLFGASFDDILNDKNKQAEITRKDIDECKIIIKNNSAALVVLQKEMDSLQTQVNHLDMFLKDYRSEKFLSPAEISEETDSVIALQSEIQATQKSLKGKIVNLYKHGKNYELELLMSSRTPNEYLRRNEYLQKFAESRKKEMQELYYKRFIIEEKKKLLSLSTSSQRFYVESKRSERAVLAGRLNTVSSKVYQIETESDIQNAKIALLRQELNNIKNFISNLTEHKKTFQSTKTSRINYASDDFEKVKGTLNLPIDIGLIRSNFGENNNNSTYSKIFNNGVDFSIARGSKVYAIANGSVNLIGEIPGYGKVIIISHDNGYRTVYSGLIEISVNTGDKVRLNQVIGKSGENFGQQLMHFEIWHDKDPLNPSDWLRLH